MLPTCNRCQKRKIKCDRLLPSCHSCAQAKLDCTFYDHGSQQNLPRSYVALLDKRVHDLRDELATLKARETPIEPPQLTATSAMSDQSAMLRGPGVTNDTSIALSPQMTRNGSIDLSYSLTFALPSRFYLGPATAATVGSMVMKTGADLGLTSISEALSGIDKPSSAPYLLEVSLPSAKKVDWSLVPPRTMHELINYHFLLKVHPVYPVLDPADLVVHTQVRSIPVKRRFVIIMAAAISAARLGHRHPSLQATALILRSWADSIVAEIFNDSGGDILQELLLLVLYELVDPSRRLVWDLLCLASRTCSKLGWHRQATHHSSNDTETVPHQATEDRHQATEDHQQRKVRLFVILYELERRICHILGRPTILRDISIYVSQSPYIDENSPFPVMLLQSHLWTKIYEAPADKCPVSKETVEIIRRGLKLTPEWTSTWLMLYPICWHSCSECCTTERWVDEIETAAILSIDKYEEVHNSGRLLSMWLATCGVFNSGCILVDIYLRKTSAASNALSSPAEKHLKHVLACSNMLFAFAECWDPARTFRDVFSKVMDAFWEMSGVK